MRRGSGWVRPPTSTCGAVSWSSCRWRTASSTPRCCRWCCITRPRPPRALTEVARVVRPGGRLLVVDMLPHEREDYQQQMGHVWLGFSEAQVGRFLNGAGFGDVRFRQLPADPDAKGPALFAAAAIKSSCSGEERSVNRARMAECRSRFSGERHGSSEREDARVRRGPAGRPAGLQGGRPEPGRVGPQGAAPRRARDARPDGASASATPARSRWPAPASWAACT